MSVSFIKILFVGFIFLLLFTSFSYAEEENDQKVTQKKDTTLFSESEALIGTASVTNSTNFEDHLSQNPTTALFKSMVIPGLGQFGNKKYIKAIVFASFDAWMISKAISYKNKASDLKKQFDNETDISLRNSYYNLYQVEKDNRNKFTWYAVITSFISMFDAYVDAHLSGFPSDKKQNDLSIDIVPIDEDGAMISLSLSF